jgi:hypothetical protein
MLLMFAMGWLTRIGYVRRKKIMAALKEPAE